MKKYILNENDQKISKKRLLSEKKLFHLFLFQVNMPFDAVIFNLSIVDCFM
jgi:hypothetical protein